MKFVSLDIQNVRGIASLSLQLDGQSCVIDGANGTGKSSIIDAIDFRLTGEIGRLTGPGTGGMTLQAHGRRVGSGQAPAYVRAVVTLPTGVSATITRGLAPRAPLECEPKHAAATLAPYLALADRGQHLLTRKALLRLVLSAPNERWQAVEALLDLHEIEEVRKALGSARTELEREARQKRTELENAQRAAADCAGRGSFSDKAVLEFVNAARRCRAPRCNGRVGYAGYEPHKSTDGLEHGRQHGSAA